MLFSVPPRDKLRLLASVSFFDGLDERTLESLVPACRSASFAAKEEICHKGDAGTQLYIVVSGSVKALTTSADGDDVVFNIMGPGEVFGEIAVLGEEERTATVVAIEPCELLVLDRRDLLAFLRRHPEVAIRLLALMAERVRRLSELFEDIQFLNLPFRLAKKLHGMVESYGEPDGDGIRIGLKLSQAEWGDLVGATRESINKQLRAWTEEGLIRLDAGQVVIEKPKDLERLARISIL
jgi:CRP-like cAMP-binding protein